MGCDIHCYIEYKKKNDDHWRSFGGRINPGRNYTLFGVMAGVRCDGLLYPLRGFPEDAAFQAISDNHLFATAADDRGTEGAAW